MKAIRWGCLLLLGLPAWLGAATPTVCVVSIREDISRNTTFLIRRALREAAQQHATALVLELDTNGGRVDDTEDILRLLEHAPLKTYAFVNAKAYSAGSYIAAATDQIYMAPGSVIGAATPIVLGLEKLSASHEEKLTSAMRALVRTTAQQKGHNPDVFEAMVDKELGLTVAGTNLCEKGKLLTLTNAEAAREYGQPAKALLSAGTVEDLPAVLKKLGLTGASVVTVQPFGFEVLARWITTISPLLLLLGFLALWVEFTHPGVTLPGLAALACFGLYFLGFFAAGLAGWEEVALFSLGAVLLALEIFVIPGFGLTGVAGILCLLAGLVMAMVEHQPGQSWLDCNWNVVLWRFGLGLGGAVMAGAVLMRYLPESTLFKKFELGATLSTADGYTSSRDAVGALLGAAGVAETMLRPAGKGRFGEQMVDVVTEGDFIPVGESIKIVAVEGSRVVVTKWISN